MDIDIVFLFLPYEQLYLMEAVYTCAKKLVEFPVYLKFGFVLGLDNSITLG